MSMPPPDAQHISKDALVDLVNGYLEDEARARLLAHAAQCAVCESRLREAVAVHERGAAAAPVRATRAASQTVVSVLPVAQRRRATVLRWAAAAAVVAVGVWFVSDHTTTRTSIAPRAQIAWLPSAPTPGGVRRGGSDDDLARLDAGIAAYDRRELARADSLLTQPFEYGSVEWVRRLYRANALVALGRPAEAVRAVVTDTDDERQADVIPEPWRGELQWTLMVALSQTGQHARADSLAVLLLQRDDAIGARARQLRDARSPR